MSNCKYTTKYFDYNKKEPTIFNCSEKPLQTGFCKFHDEKFEDNDDLIKQITQKINGLAKNDPLFCIGFKIPKIKLNNSISGPVYFTRAIIQDADFSGAKFENADFSGAKFENADFSGAKFENAEFLAVKFNGQANFSNTVFKNKVNFSESVFNEANFNDSILNKAQFIGAKFKTADFVLAKLIDSDFFGVVFEGITSFIGADLKSCEFPNAKFQNIAHFTGAKLNKTVFPDCMFKTANFDNTTLRVVVFQNATFQGNANFSLAELEKVDFFKANFKNDINFGEANLQQVTFSEATIDGTANFVKTTFQDDVKFKKLEINQANFTDAKFNGNTFFHDVFFKNQEKIIFDVDDLSKVSFLNSDITKVRFGERVRWAGKDGFTIVDEIILKDSLSGKNLESLIATYRMLKKNYQDRYRSEEANRFLEREIELKKMYEQNEPPLKITNIEILEDELTELKKENQELKRKISDLGKQVGN